jgi:hypothetical protein
MKKFLWFAEADVETSNEALLLPVDRYLGADPVTGGLFLYFADIEGHPTREQIKLGCTNGNQAAVLKAFAQIMNSAPHSDGFIVVADANVANGQTAEYHKAFNGLVTSIAIT